MPASVANRGPKVICNGMEVIFKDVKVTGVRYTNWTGAGANRRFSSAPGPRRSRQYESFGPSAEEMKDEGIA